MMGNDRNLIPEFENLYETKDWEHILAKSSESPQDPEIQYYRALAMQQLHQFYEAIKVFESIYTHVGVLKEIDYNLGLCHYHLNNIDQAIEYLRRYMYSSPSHPSIYFHLVKVMLIKNLHADIDDVCERAVVSRSKKIPYRIWAYSLYKLKKYKEAHEKCLLILDKNKEEHSVWFLLGKVLRKCKYIKESRAALEKCCSLDPENLKYKKKYESLITKISTKPEYSSQKPKIQLDTPILPKQSAIKFAENRGCEDLFCLLF
ncbi:unnamed protein product [Blepharisma stoltei]|uniref:Uncharacterized protein n=1 Tax=Blepharisma stoltei TaxID=1481888 RepID=A0AAU9IWG6_9CILI|nr:unnamed protein product [Blepharisma stoltei]